MGHISIYCMKQEKKQIRLISINSVHTLFAALSLSIIMLTCAGCVSTDCPKLKGKPGNYSAEQVEEFFKSTDTLIVNRGFTLPEGAVLDRQVEIWSPVYEPMVIDLNGGQINSVRFRSLKNADGSYCRLKNVTLKNGTVNGNIRVQGMAINGEDPELRESSYTLGHTARAQANAPTRITIDNITINTTRNSSSLYLSPGANYITVKNSCITGTGRGLSVYLDTESAYNKFLNNTFEKQSNREAFAVDGSTHNIIMGNRFTVLDRGGIYIYRNCGEGGTIRHQEPRFNVILNNEFVYDNYTGNRPAIFLGSRQGNRSYCNLDDGYSFGSSIDNHDFARENIVIGNTTTTRDHRKAIRDNDIQNIIQDNYDNNNPRGNVR